jgi:adenine-specific DNA-methyltransferase
MLRDRLVQIRKLLSRDGSVWVHLDDSEVHRARSVLDEVFGPEQFVATVMWQKRYSRSNDALFSVSHDYILVYAARNGAFSTNRLARGEDPQYSNPDGDPLGPWRGIPWDAPEERKGLDYPITTPVGSVKLPPRGRHWSGTEKGWQQVVAEGRDYYGKKMDGMPNVKRYLSEMPGLVPNTVWLHSEVGHNDSAKKEIQALFPDILPFATPKPEALLQRIVSIATEPGDIVLDCFAGSGTTAAVAHKMQRRWVTVEMSPDNVERYVAPRLRRVIAGDDPGGITSATIVSDEGVRPEGVTLDEMKAALKVARLLTVEEEPDGEDQDTEQHDTAQESGSDDDIEPVQLSKATRKELLALMRAGTKTSKTVEYLWSGGGGFRVLEVAPSMFEEDDGVVFLADWATGGALADAVCAQLRFDRVQDGPFAGRKGRRRLAVIDGMLTAGVVDHLVSRLDEKETLIVVAQALEPGVEDYVREVRSGSRARKVPRDLARTGVLGSRLVRLDVAPDSEAR